VQTDKGYTKSNTKELIIAELICGRKNKEIAEMFDVSAAYVSECKADAQKLELGYLDKVGKPTPKGLGLLDKFKEDDGSIDD